MKVKNQQAPPNTKGGDLNTLTARNLDQIGTLQDKTETMTDNLSQADNLSESLNEFERLTASFSTSVAEKLLKNLKSSESEPVVKSSGSSKPVTYTGSDGKPVTYPSLKAAAEWAQSQPVSQVFQRSPTQIREAAEKNKDGWSF